MHTYLENVVSVEFVNFLQDTAQVRCPGLRGDNELDPRQCLEALQLERVGLEFFNARRRHGSDLEHGIAFVGMSGLMVLARVDKRVFAVDVWVYIQ